jgi:hypothetical protein
MRENNNGNQRLYRLPIAASSCDGVTYRQATEDDVEVVTEMRNNISIHLSQLPMFMPFFTQFTLVDTITGIKGGYYQYFISLKQNRPVAYIRLQKTGENFACDEDS